MGSPHVTPSKQQSSASHSNVESAGVYTPGNVYHPLGSNASGHIYYPSRTNTSRHVYHTLSMNTSRYKYRLSRINISGHVYGMDSYATEKKYFLEDHLDLPADLTTCYAYEFALKLSSCRPFTHTLSVAKDVLFTYSYKGIRLSLFMSSCRKLQEGLGLHSIILRHVATVKECHLHT